MTGFVDSAWRVVRPGETAFYIWRIEKLQVKAVPRDQYGSFYNGDSYIVYNAANNKTVNDGGKLQMDIHFWLGNEASTDEITTAAIKAVELDDFLGGDPIQHREVQGYESSKFKSYFKSGIRVLNGGVASGLNHVTKEFNARLFRVKGRRSPLLTEQPSVSWHFINSGDCFILETANKVFVWVGAQANRMEKLQAAKVAMQFKDERSDRVIVFVEDGNESEMIEGDKRDFMSYLPLESRQIEPAEPDSDEKTENERTTLKLYRCSDESGTCKIIFEKEGPLLQSDLNSNDSFIVDNQSRGIWVWVGKKATPEERRQSMSNAQGFVKKKEYASKTPVTRVIDGAEPTEFKMLFIEWRDPRTTNGINRQYSVSRIAPTVNNKFDAASLHSTPGLAADTQLVDDGTGEVQVWRLVDKELVPVPSDHFGVFFDGDCYLVHYSFNVLGSGTKHILYYWQGSHSAQDERGTIAWHTVKKDDELGGAAVQVRIVQSKEPPHFLLIFRGKMIVFNGGVSSAFEGGAGEYTGVPSEFMLQVRGGESHNTRAVQVPLRASCLNSNDVFVLATSEKAYLWCGKGSTGDERERAKSIAGQWAAKAELTVVSEGQEKSDFWAMFPEGKEPYASDERLKNSEIKQPARLFQCSNASGTFKAEEILDFSQDDLVTDDVMVLDVGSAVFIWIGSSANKEEKLSTGTMVYEYLESDPRNRDLDTPVFQIRQGYEPPNFTGFFGVWDAELWKSNDFEALRTKIEAIRVVTKEDLIPYRKDLKKYPLNVLRETDPEKLPQDIDLLHKEMHLTEEDFVTAFGIEKGQYENLPQWRQINLKKSAKLY